jgi:uncharacterized membrane protein
VWGIILCTNLNDFVHKFVWDFVRNHYVWFVHKFCMGVLRGLSGFILCSLSEKGDDD